MKSWYSFYFNHANSDSDDMELDMNASNKETIASILLIAIIMFFYGHVYIWKDANALNIPQLNNIVAFILVLITIYARIGLYLYERRNEKSDYGRLIIGEMIIVAVMVFFGFNLLFDINILHTMTFAETLNEEIAWSIGIPTSLLILIPILTISREGYRTDLKREWDDVKNMPKGVKNRFWIAFLLFIVVPIAVFIPLYLGTTFHWEKVGEDESGNAIMEKVANSTYSTSVLDANYFWIIVVIVMAVVLFAMIILFNKKELGGMTSKDIRIDTIGSFISLVIICVIVPILILVFVIPQINDIAFEMGSMFQGSIEVYQAQETTNYFSYVFYILLQSPAPALMIGFMVFGAIAVMVAQNIGGVGRVIGGFATGVVVIIPMLFIISIFTGGIEAPQLLIDILGVGVAQMVFGLAETSAFILMISIIGVFISAGRLLGSMASGGAE